MGVDIICTIGPASSSQEVLSEMLIAGMTVARLNMSHGDHESHREAIRNLRQTASDTGRPIRIMGDLQGPKIRLGDFPSGGVDLEEGQDYELVTEPVLGDREKAYIDYPEIVYDLAPGAIILINDGEVKLRATNVTTGGIQAKVVVGGKIDSNKGVNFPETSLNIRAITDKDREDLSFLLGAKVDMIACSFIRQASNIEDIKKLGRSLAASCPELIAKIETWEGIKNFRSIAALSEGIMIARGDLGVELPYEQIPLIQQALLRECRASKHYVITATQMLQSMIEKPVPTRAEVTDIFIAVQDGTNAVMLSGESSIGNYPVESVKVLSRVSQFAAEKARVGGYTLDELYAVMSFVEK